MILMIQNSMMTLSIGKCVSVQVMKEYGEMKV
jgi:hypothetical protein